MSEHSRKSTGISRAGDFGLVIKNPFITVQPGQICTLQFEIANRGEDEQFGSELFGVPEDWNISFPSSFGIARQVSKPVFITISVPYLSSCIAKDYPMVLRVFRDSVPDTFLEAKFTLRVLPYYQFSCDFLDTGETEVGKLPIQITMKNDGNAVETLTITYHDRSNHLLFRNIEKKYVLDPGASKTISIIPTLRRFRWFGRALKRHPYSLYVKSVSSETKKLDGEVLSKGLFPLWLPFLLAGILIGMVIMFWQYAIPEIYQVEIEPLELVKTSETDGVVISWRVDDFINMHFPFGYKIVIYPQNEQMRSKQAVTINTCVHTSSVDLKNGDCVFRESDSHYRYKMSVAEISNVSDSGDFEGKVCIALFRLTLRCADSFAGAILTPTPTPSPSPTMTATSTPTIEPTFTRTLTPSPAPSRTSLPPATSTIEPTLVLVVPTAIPSEVPKVKAILYDMVVHSGPNTPYEPVGGLLLGKTARVISYKAYGDNIWYKIKLDNGIIGWVSGGINGTYYVEPIGFNDYHDLPEESSP